MTHSDGNKESQRMRREDFCAMLVSIAGLTSVFGLMVWAMN